MQVTDVAVVGGGPAGSTCAWKLREAGLDVVVLDRAAFPRPKLCAGWVTPKALQDLELEPGAYPAGLMTFEALTIHWKWLTLTPKSRQHAIRRYEFDDYLLRRSGARVLKHRVRDVRRDGGDFVLDDIVRSKYLVGAGGTACPVYRSLFRDRSRDATLQTATLEQEFRYDWDDPACHLWFFDDGLPGYAWYVPKENGYINVGVGAVSTKLRQRGGHLKDHWAMFTTRLRRQGLVRSDDYDPGGYSYFIRGDVEALNDRNAYIIGDAAGLATRDMCEGIGPAIESGLLAAEAIVTGGDYSLAGIHRYSGSGMASRLLERGFCG